MGEMNIQSDTGLEDLLGLIILDSAVDR
jgi:hypothetical protein